MTSTGSVELPSLWAEQWAVQIAVEINRVRSQVRIAAAQPLDDRRREIVSAVNELLEAAGQASRRDPRRAAATSQRARLQRRRSLRDRWRGTSVEQGFQSLHAAKVFLVDLLPEDEVRAMIPGVVARARVVLDRDDPRRAQVDRLLIQERDRKGGAVPIDRAELKQAMQIAYNASDELHVRVRDFRNILFVAAALIGILMALLVLVVQRSPEAMPLCFSPPATTAAAVPSPSPMAAAPSTPRESLAAAPSPGATASPASTASAGTPAPKVGTVTVCPSGERPSPSPGDVVIVAGLGLLGGALAAAFAIRNIRGTSTPYDIPIALAFLKVPSGSLTAVAGILLLGGGFVPGLSELDTQRQILAYALVFGYAQQLATRFIDNRAQSLLNSVPSKDPEAEQAERPATPLEPTLPPRVPAGTSEGVGRRVSRALGLSRGSRSG
jgi:hypothetical protein